MCEETETQQEKLLKKYYFDTFFFVELVILDFLYTVIKKKIRIPETVFASNHLVLLSRR